MKRLVVLIKLSVDPARPYTYRGGYSTRRGRNRVLLNACKEARRIFWDTYEGYGSWDMEVLHEHQATGTRWG